MRPEAAEKGFEEKFQEGRWLNFKTGGRVYLTFCFKLCCLRVNSRAPSYQ